MSKIHLFRRLRVLVYLMTLIVLAVTAFAVQRETTENRGASRFSVNVVASLPYGNSTSMVGTQRDVPEQQNLGPQSIAADESSVLLLDSVNDRLLRIDGSGRVTESIEVADSSTDVREDANGNVYVLTPALQRVEVLTRSGARAALEYSGEVGLLSTDAEGHVFVKPIDGKAEVLRPKNVSSSTLSLGADATGSPEEPVNISRVDDHTKALVRKADAARIIVTTKEYSGSIEYLGSDYQGRIFVAVDEVLPSTDGAIHVAREVRAYDRSGAEIARAPLTFDYASVPNRDLTLASDGTIYHLRPTETRVLIERISLGR